MQQNTTPEAGGSADLAPDRVKALAALGSGSSITDAACAAGVDRTTVHRWLRNDPAFQAAWNSLRRDLLREVEADLQQLVADAIQAVRDALRSGDARVGLALLKGVGLLPGWGPTIGPEDAGEVAQEADLARRERESARLVRRMTIL